MKAALRFLLLFLSQSCLFGQNLIQNGSFEQHSALNCGGGGFVPTNWLWVNSPDYFNSACGSTTNGYGVPKNLFGYCPPKNGNAYAGIGQIVSNEYKEYVVQQLATPLDSGQGYCLSFFVSKSDRLTYAVGAIGGSVSAVPPVNTVLNFVLGTPQVVNTSGPLTDTSQWVEISGYFVAQGGEQFVTIGNFFWTSNSDTLQTPATNPFPPSAGPPGAYYYVDSVTLYACDPPPPPPTPTVAVTEPPNVFTPNEDGQNDTWRWEVPGAKGLKFTIYNRWGNIIYKPELKDTTVLLWDGRTTSGEKCSEGYYYYVIEYTDTTGQAQKKKGFIDLFR